MTDKQPTKTQIKKVLEWCGWKEVQEKRLINEGSAEEFVEDSHWEDPEGGQWSIDKEPDLNNLFKYAVPKLLSKKWKLRLSWNSEIENSRPKVSLIYVGKEYSRQERPHVQITSKDPALALFWAIWEVIHNDK